MKNDRYQYSPIVRKLVIFQFAASIFGVILFATAVMRSGTDKHWLEPVTSILSIFLFLFIQYTSVWDFGSRDRITVDSGKMEYNRFIGLKAALFANVPNFILGVGCFLFRFIGIYAGESFEKVALVLMKIAQFWEGMYMGMFSWFLPVGASPTGQSLYMLCFVAYTIPSLIIVSLAYNAGYNNVASLRIKKKENK